MSPFSAKANEALFTVRGVQVDETAGNALAARDIAFEKAQKIAFKRIMDRLAVQNVDVDNQIPDSITLGRMIKDYELTQEKSSGVRYIGTYTFRFDDRAVKKYFSGRAVRYTDIKSDPILILPFYEGANGAVLWSYTNAWKEAWDTASAEPQLVPIIVPIGDLQDVADISDEQMITYQPERLQSLLQRYGAKEAVIAHAVPSGASADALSIQGMGGMVVNLYKTDAYGPQHVLALEVSPREGDTDAMLLAGAVKRVRGLLSQNWKAQTGIAQAQAMNITVSIPIATLAHWAKVQESLTSISPVREVNVQSLSAGRVVVDLAYDGTLDRLQLALSRADMGLIEGPGGTYGLDVQSVNVGAAPSYQQSF